MFACGVAAAMLVSVNKGRQPSPLGIELDFYAKIFVLLCFGETTCSLITRVNQRKEKNNTCHAKYIIHFDLNDLLLVVELSTNTI